MIHMRVMILFACSLVKKIAIVYAMNTTYSILNQFFNFQNINRH